MRRLKAGLFDYGEDDYDQGEEDVYTLLFLLFVYPSDTVLIRLGKLSLVAMMGLCDDTTCIMKPTVRKS